MHIDGKRPDIVDSSCTISRRRSIGGSRSSDTSRAIVEVEKDCPKKRIDLITMGLYEYVKETIAPDIHDQCELIIVRITKRLGEEYKTRKISQYGVLFPMTILVEAFVYEL